MKYIWMRRNRLPILYVDPAPFLGPYIYQRILTDMMPRPVAWWPTNWLLLPICWLVDAASHVRAIAAAARAAYKDPDNAS